MSLQLITNGILALAIFFFIVQCALYVRDVRRRSQFYSLLARRSVKPDPPTSLPKAPAPKPPTTPPKYR